MSERTEPRPRPTAVFLDRDGTLITETGYLTDPRGFEFVPGAVDALRRLNEAEIPVALVTNQSAVARGWLTEERLEAIHAALRDRLAHAGARLDEILYCPHHPTEGPDGAAGPFTGPCECRKPLPGMLTEAAQRFGVDLRQAVTIGDSDRDLRAGESAGVRAILVLTGKGARERETSQARLGDTLEVVADLAAAVDRLLGSDPD